MRPVITYLTGNESKFKNAESFLSANEIYVEQTKVSLDEIQSDSGEKIAIGKVRQGFKLLGRPVFVNDASWEIPALNGFPGPYMKYVANWLTNDDFLRLMQNKSDRTIRLIDVIAYKDAHQEKVFTRSVSGILLTEARGVASGPPITQLISLSTDGKSVAESSSIGFSDEESLLWLEFADWIKAEYQA